ncbi:hypothetical protein QBC36DRAFT_182302 [Triangularia setosa]|uniref:Uncharacterized protein n=1 Tax=Triangularia setosa TaxID=2587417 RepID=A0AAN6WAU4_9PEZI|nr:hypothetical protein QBC36DRAFT_182302 [Podospora setosa]
MEAGTGNEGGTICVGFSALLDEVAEEIWISEEAEEEVGVHGDGLASASWPRPTVETEKPLSPLPSMIFEGQGSWRRKPHFRPSLSAVRNMSPVPPAPSCPLLPPPTASVPAMTEASSDELDPADKGRGRAADEEKTASRPTFRLRMATAPTDTRTRLSFSSAAPPTPRLPAPLAFFVRRMWETSAPPRLADRPLHPDLLRERVTPFIHAPSLKRASTEPMAPMDRSLTPPQAAQPEPKSRWSPSPPPSPTQVQKFMNAMSFASLRSQKSKTNLQDQSSSCPVPPVPALPPTSLITTKRSSNRSSAGSKKSSDSFGRGTSPSLKSTWMTTASVLDPTWMGRDVSSVSRPRTTSGRTERSSASSSLSMALSRQASTITPERTQAELPPLAPFPPLSASPPAPPQIPPMPAALSSPPHPPGLRRKISMPSMFLRKKKSSVGKKEDTGKKKEDTDKEDN